MNEQDNIQQLIEIYNRRLQLLNEQRAYKGLNASPELIMEIQDTEKKLAELREERSQEQRTRITTGIEEEREKILLENQRRSSGKGQRIVGQRLSSFVEYFKDREKEQKSISQLLSKPNTRIVSIIGHGGIGKTALASKVLGALENNYWPHIEEEYEQTPVDGIVYLSTRTKGINLERLFLDCGDLVDSTKRTSLISIWTNSNIDIKDKVIYLLETLKEGFYIILLDNTEDLLDEDGHFSDSDLKTFFEIALTMPHNIKLLVTSRIPISFSQEVMKFDNRIPLLSGLPIDEGIAMLRDLDPNGDYNLKEASKDNLAKAVTLVKGVPRALEVIASILANDPFLTLDELVEKFFNRNEVVEALIQDAYKRLNRESQQVMEALAVFARPIPQVAIDYLIEPFAKGVDLPTILRRLVQTHVVSIERKEKTVVLHPIDRDYVYSQLPKTGHYSLQTLERRAADYYGMLRQDPSTYSKINDLQPQLFEFEHRLKASDYDTAAKIINEIDYNYLSVWGYTKRVIGMRQQLRNHISDEELAGLNLGYLGWAYHEQGEYELTLEYYQEAIKIAQKLKNKHHELMWINRTGKAYHILSEYAQALTHYGQALALAKKTGDRYEECFCLGGMGDSYTSIGDLDKALNSHQQALLLALELNHKREECDRLGSLGRVHSNLSKYQEAISFYQRALALAREIGDQREESWNLGSLANIYSDQGELNNAIIHYQQAFEISRDIGHKRSEGIHLASIGVTYHKLGEYEKSIKYHKDALSLAEDIGDRRGESPRLVGLGNAYLDLDEYETSINYLEKSLQVAEEVSHLENINNARFCLSQAYLYTDQLEKALNVINAIVIKKSTPNSYSFLALKGVILLILNQKEEASVNFKKSIGFADAILSEISTLYSPKYVQGLAFSGLTILFEEEERQYLNKAINAYLSGIENCKARGVVKRELQLLDKLMVLDKKNILQGVRENLSSQLL